MSIGTFLASFLQRQEDISKSSDAVKESRSFSGLLSATFGMLTQKKMLLLLSLLIYSGLQQAFIWYVHTILDKVTDFIIFIVEIWILNLHNFVVAIWNLMLIRWFIEFFWNYDKPNYHKILDWKQSQLVEF